jgi:hypothetical protein
MRWILTLVCLLGFAFTSASEDVVAKYSSYGKVLMVQLKSAPFPHPARAEGHKYHDEFFSAKDHYSDSTVGIFIPKGFREADKIDFVVHFHGWRNNVAGVFARYKLIEQLVESHRNAILVVPQGPYNAADSFGGKMEDTDGFKNLMTDVIETVKKSGGLKKQNVAIGRIILSGHSGGYGAMAGILSHGGLSDHINEVWLFDALYAHTDTFMNWFQEGAGKRMLNIYTEHGGTRIETQTMIDLLQKHGFEPVVGEENDMDDKDLGRRTAVFLFTDMEHNDVIDKRKTFQRFLATSSLELVKAGGIEVDPIR